MKNKTHYYTDMASVTGEPLLAQAKVDYVSILIPVGGGLLVGGAGVAIAYHYKKNKIVFGIIGAIIGAAAGLSVPRNWYVVSPNKLSQSEADAIAYEISQSPAKAKLHPELDMLAEVRALEFKLLNAGYQYGSGGKAIKK